jgi:hypothetical protein
MKAGVKRAPRGVTVGRENHCGSGSEQNIRVAALFYSLIESAKRAGVEPRAYLREATLRASGTRGGHAPARPQVLGILRGTGA